MNQVREKQLKHTRQTPKKKTTESLKTEWAHTDWQINDLRLYAQ